MQTPFSVNCMNMGETVGHTHSSWSDLMACVGTDTALTVVVRRTPAPRKAPVNAPTSPAATPTGVVRVDAEPTVPQLAYIKKLGGSWRDAALENRGAAGELITMLKDPDLGDSFRLPPMGTPSDADEWDAFPQEVAWICGNLGPEWKSPDDWFNHSKQPNRPVSAPPAPVAASQDDDYVPAELTNKSRLEALLPLLDDVPDGYYAVDLGDGTPLKFLRLSSPKTGRYARARKVQTIHGPSMENAWVKWPSGRVSVYSHKVEDLILAVMTNHTGAARKYAKEIDRCCRCNTRLTDERSRRFGIGPECEKHWPHIIQEVLLEEEAAKEA